MTATATDNAGNSASIQTSYTVAAPDVWSLSGFYQPVDMKDASGNVVVNTIKSGQSVPMKFEVFVNNIERTDATIGGTTIKSFTQQQISCGAVSSSSLDAIEEVTTGSTSLKYDPANGGQFIGVWKTPSGQQNNCYRVAVTTMDNSSLVAFFKLK